MKNQFIGDNLADEGMLCFFVTLRSAQRTKYKRTKNHPVGQQTKEPPGRRGSAPTPGTDRWTKQDGWTPSQSCLQVRVCVGGCSFHSGLKIGLFFSRSTLVFWQRCLRWSWIPRQILLTKIFVLQILLAGNRTPPGFWKQKWTSYCDCRCWLVPWHIIIQAVFALLLFDFERSLFLGCSSAVDHLSLVQKPVQVVHAVVCVGLGGNGSVSFVKQLLSYVPLALWTAEISRFSHSRA